MASLLTGPPSKFPIPWANAAGGTFVRAIPVNSQIGVQDGAASLTDGFPPDCFTPESSGGVPPFGQDANGILKQITQGLQWLEAGGVAGWDAAFATSINGYPIGAVLWADPLIGGTAADVAYVNIADGNLANPNDLFATGWVRMGLPAGTPVASFSSTVPYGYVAANELTIGNASSNATQRANQDTLRCYAAIWNGFSASLCPIYTSGGVLTSRGANAFADYSANKAIATPGLRGLGLRGVDGMGNSPTGTLAGVPVQIGNVTTPTSIVGENLHVLTQTETAAHIHANTLTDPTHRHVNTLTDPQHTHSSNAQVNLANASAQTGGGFTSTGAGFATINAASTGITINNVFVATGLSINNASIGGGGSHNNVPFDMLVYWNLKL